MLSKEGKKGRGRKVEERGGGGGKLLRTHARTHAFVPYVP